MASRGESGEVRQGRGGADPSPGALLPWSPIEERRSPARDQSCHGNSASYLPVTSVSVPTRNAHAARGIQAMSDDVEERFPVSKGPLPESGRVPGRLNDGARDLRCPSAGVILESTFGWVNAIDEVAQRRRHEPPLQERRPMPRQGVREDP